MSNDQERLQRIADQFFDCYSCPVEEAYWAIDKGYLCERKVTRADAEEMDFFEETGLAVGDIMWDWTALGLKVLDGGEDND